MIIKHAFEYAGTKCLGGLFILQNFSHTHFLVLTYCNYIQLKLMIFRWSPRRRMFPFPRSDLRFSTSLPRNNPRVSGTPTCGLRDRDLSVSWRPEFKERAHGGPAVICGVRFIDRSRAPLSTAPRSRPPLHHLRQQFRADFGLSRNAHIPSSPR